MAEEFTPIVVKLGKKSRKRIKDLLRGRAGDLQSEAAEALREVREGLGADAVGKELVPIVVVYTKKQRKRGRMKLPSLF